MSKPRRKAPRGGKIIKRLWRRLRAPLLLTAFAAAGVALVAGWWATGRITSRFEAREHETTSRLLGRPFPLVEGTPCSQRDLLRRLELLGYKEVRHRAEGPGTYAVRGETVQIHLNPFRDPDGDHAARVVRVSFDGGGIEDVDSQGAELEPAVIALFHGPQMEERELVKLDQVPKQLIAAILAAEDQRFYTHPGIDPIGILRALWADVTSASFTQGGSTLTQQLAKNLYFSDEKSLLRKGEEAFAAVVLTREYSKDRILRAYLNEIYLGQHGPASVRGVARASRFYFGASVSDLDLAQSALLAGMIRSPGHYNPFIHPKAARERRRLVLHAMEADGFIKKQERLAAEREPLPRRQASQDDWNTHAAYVADLLEQDLEATHGAEFRSEDLRIHTTIDPLYQEAAEKAVRAGLERIEKTHPRLKRKKGGPLQAALVSIDLRDGGIVAMVGGRGFADSQFNRVTSAHRQPGSLFKPVVYLAGMMDGADRNGDEDGDRPDSGDDDHDVVRGPPSATPDVIPARLEGRQDEGLVHARKRWHWFWEKPEPEPEEQPVDPMAVTLPLTAASILQDQPYEVQTGDKTWAPNNYDHLFRGPVTVQRALEESLNVPTARAAAAIGLPKILAMGKTLGIESKLPEVPSIALGTADVSPMEMATVFATIASGGKLRKPFLLRGVTAPNDEPGAARDVAPSRLEDESAHGSVLAARLDPDAPQAIPERYADVMTALLEGVVDNGTGRTLRAEGFRGSVAGKTGTSDGGRDLWFCGFTPRMLTLVWVGFDDNTPTYLTGASGSIPIWFDYMRSIGAATGASFPGDDGLIWVPIDPTTGQIARRSCPETSWAPFIPGTEPTERCEAHRSHFLWWRD